MLYKKYPYIDPIHFYQKLNHQVGMIFLDSGGCAKATNRYSFIVIKPLKIFKGGLLLDTFANFAKIIQQNQILYNEDLPPFVGGLVGYVSYDQGKNIENIKSRHEDKVPGLYFGLYNQVIAFDHVERSIFLMVSVVNDLINHLDKNNSNQPSLNNLNYKLQFENLCNLYEEIANAQLATNDICHADIALAPLNITPGITRDKYLQKLQQIREYILDGDIYEINFTYPFYANLPKDYPCHLLYERLRRINPAPFGAYLNLGEIKILSSSPERFICASHRKLEVRPIKGTIQRSSNPLLDKEYAKELELSEKDRAENIMIVDLMRNDLSKICTAKSVVVDTLCGVESYTSLHHLVSVVSGELMPDKTIFDGFLACFPGGSITGAPKIRVMELIEELEDECRGVYCGNIGYFSFNGNMDFSIAIRTITINQDRLSYNVGGAITLDSKLEDEYQETLLKGNKIKEAINFKVRNEVS